MLSIILSEQRSFTSTGEPQLNITAANLADVINLPIRSNVQTNFYPTAKKSLNVTEHNVGSCAARGCRPDHLGDGIVGAARPRAALNPAQNPAGKQGGAAFLGPRSGHKSMFSGSCFQSL